MHSLSLQMCATTLAINKGVDLCGVSVPGRTWRWSVGEVEVGRGGAVGKVFRLSYSLLPPEKLLSLDDLVSPPETLPALSVCLGGCVSSAQGGSHAGGIQKK